MKKFTLLLFTALSLGYFQGHAQVVMTTGNIPVSSALVPFGSSCFAASPTNTSVCGFTATFQFTATQCCACPTSGMVCLPGSVAYGGPGSSSSFLNYHTLSYSPSNEHQRISFSQKINRFQWSTSGPWGAAEPFMISVYDGGVLLQSFSFTVPGTGLRNTYYISAPQFDRLDFTETNAISADDELMGDFRVTTAGCPLAMDRFQTALDIMGDRKVKVHWETEGEMGNDRHILYYSTDAVNWQTLAEMPAQEGSGRYSFMHDQAQTGMNYYFVQVLGEDGNEQTSHIMEAQFGDGSAIQVNVFPNPANDQLMFDFAGLAGQKDVTVINHLGQVVLQAKTDQFTMDMDVAMLPSALYFVHVTSMAGKSVHKIEVLH